MWLEKRVIKTIAGPDEDLVGVRKTCGPRRDGLMESRWQLVQNGVPGPQKRWFDHIRLTVGSISYQVAQYWNEWKNVELSNPFCMFHLIVNIYKRRSRRMRYRNNRYRRCLSPHTAPRMFLSFNINCDLKQLASKTVTPQWTQFRYRQISSRCAGQ